MSIHKKLMQARLKLQTADLKKAGHNKFDIIKINKIGIISYIIIYKSLLSKFFYVYHINKY